MSGTTVDVRIGRVYDAADDGRLRVLVDRLWPRGMHRDDPRVGEWCKQVAPSTELRRWYGHDPARQQEFEARYEEELDTPEGRRALADLTALVAGRPATLVTATKDVTRSELPVLLRVLQREGSGEGASDG